jgi:hypothetical protein
MSHECDEQNMIVTKRQKQHDPSPTPSRKLFIDYPYPVMTELNRTYMHQESSDHPHALPSLRWYKDCFHKMFGVINILHNHNTPISIIEKSFKQTHIDRRSSNVIVNDMQKKTKPCRTARVLASSMRQPKNDRDEERVPKLSMKLRPFD